MTEEHVQQEETEQIEQQPVLEDGGRIRVRRAALLDLLFLLKVLLGHEVGASSSTTSYSPSSTTSSPESVESASPPEACACCAAWA